MMRSLLYTLIALSLWATDLRAAEVQHGPSSGASKTKTKTTGMAITGNLEMPKLLRTIPWQRADRSITPKFTALGERLEPVDPVILRRKTEMRQWLNQNLP